MKKNMGNADRIIRNYYCRNSCYTLLYECHFWRTGHSIIDTGWCLSAHQPGKFLSIVRTIWN
jgi:hypothetical protein